MSIFRVNSNKDYTVMNNYHLKDKTMSLKSKGLLSVMLSLPDNWDYSINGLVSICKESKNTIVSVLDELKKLGYLKVTKTTDSLGRFDYIYDIYEKPYPQPKKPAMDKPAMVTPSMDISPQLNTKELNTNKLITKDNKEIYKESISLIVDYLNSKAKTNYRNNTPKTQSLIIARLKEGYKLEDFQKVIDVKTTEWLGTDMSKYLRPETLFGNKFENYLNQIPKEEPKDRVSNIFKKIYEREVNKWQEKKQ